MKTVSTRWTAAVLAACVTAGFAIRTIPAYPDVFPPDGVVNFQEGDAWFHARSVHNLLAHFPWRSGFDPYALYPGGQNVPTGPMWDLALATTAWIAGAGHPSPRLVDGLAAWLPAVLGALFPLAVFWLGRRLFGDVAGLFAAAGLAVVEGGLLWAGHLGMADHHILESWLAFATIGLMCAAVENKPPRWRFTAIAGVMLGAYLATRPAGVFVPAALTAAAVLAPATAIPAAGALAIGAVVFLPARDSLWGSYTLLALTACLGAVLAMCGIDAVWRRRGWPANMRPVSFAAAALLAIAAAWLVRPEVAHAFAAEVWKRAGGLTGEAGAGHGVQELQPLVRSGEWAFGSLQAQFGTLWIAGLPALAWVAMQAWRSRRPALILFTVWTGVAVAGVYTQLRMTVYSAPCAAILAGVGCAWILERAGGRRTIAVAALAVLLAATNVPGSMREMHVHYSANEDWRKALAWLRTHSPEPMGNPGAWYARYPRLPARASFAYPPSAYGVGVWWNFGYFVQARAHRIPTANGTQEGTVATGRFLTDPSPESALSAMRATGTRYVMLDPALLLFRPDRSIFGDILDWSEREPRDYYRVYYAEANGSAQQALFYLPSYYRSLLVRLYLYDGGASPATETWLVAAAPAEFLGGKFEVIRWRQRFGSYREAEAYREAHRSENLTLGGFDPVVSCVPLEPVLGMTRVYTSDESPIERGRPLRAVKIFEAAGTQR